MILNDEKGIEGSEKIIEDLKDVVPRYRDLTFRELLKGITKIKNVDTHFDLKKTLIEHLYNFFTYLHPLSQLYPIIYL